MVGMAHWMTSQPRASVANVGEMGSNGVEMAADSDLFRFIPIYKTRTLLKMPTSTTGRENGWGISNAIGRFASKKPR